MRSKKRFDILHKCKQYILNTFDRIKLCTPSYECITNIETVANCDCEILQHKFISLEKAKYLLLIGQSYLKYRTLLKYCINVFKMHSNYVLFRDIVFKN